MFTSRAEMDNRALDSYVFGSLDYFTELILNHNQSVIYDANNNRMVDRDKSRAIATKCNAQTIVVWVQTPLSVAYSRELERRKYSSHIPTTDDRYEALVCTFEPTAKHEGVIYINGLDSLDEQLASFTTQLSRYKGVGTIFYHKPTDEFLFYVRDNKKSLPYPNMIDIIGEYRKPQERLIKACSRTISSELYRLKNKKPYTPKNLRLFQVYTDKANIEQAIYSVTLSRKPTINNRQGQRLIWVKRAKLGSIEFAFHFKDIVMQYADSIA